MSARWWFGIVSDLTASIPGYGTVKLTGEFDSSAVPLPPLPGQGGWFDKVADDVPYIEYSSGIVQNIICFLHSWSGTGSQAQSFSCFHRPNTVTVAPYAAGNVYGDRTRIWHPQHAINIKKVIDKAKADWNLPNARPVIAGFSGGGGSSLYALGALPGYVKGISAWLPIYDPAAWWNESPDFRADLEITFSGTPSQVPDNYAQNGPKAVLPNARDAICYINYGTQDSVTPPHHAIDAHALLSAIPSVQSTLIGYPIGHVFTDGGQGAVTAAQIDAILAA